MICVLRGIHILKKCAQDNVSADQEHLCKLNKYSQVASSDDEDEGIPIVRRGRKRRVVEDSDDEVNEAFKKARVEIQEPERSEGLGH